MTQTNAASSENAEAIQAWDGPLYDRFVRFRDIVTTGLGAHGEQALKLSLTAARREQNPRSTPTVVFSGLLARRPFTPQPTKASHNGR